MFLKGIANDFIMHPGLRTRSATHTASEQLDVLRPLWFRMLAVCSAAVLTFPGRYVPRSPSGCLKLGIVAIPTYDLPLATLWTQGKSQKPFPVATSAKWEKCFENYQILLV